MQRATTGAVVSTGLVMALAGSVLAHRPGGVTGRRIEDAFAPTFANLVEVQRSVLKLPPIGSSMLRATAQCEKLGAPKATAGAGDWKCTVFWSSPGQRTPLHDAFELSVTPDGCYTATADGDEAHLGGPTLTTRDGTTVTNLLYTFEGCFDTSEPLAIH